MREIKFRVWDTWDKKLIKNNEQAIKLMLVVKPERYVFIQFTGLLDKNGKEVYEGDIVRGKFGGIGEVKFLKEWAQYWVLTHQNDTSFYLHEEVEVIGNIYDNPDLLKGGEHGIG